MVYESTLARRPWVNLEQIVIRLENEDLSAAKLCAAWEELARQHEALRIAILWRKRDVPAQALRESFELDLTTDDWSKMTPRKQETSLEQVLASDREKGVDIERAPWRVQFIRLGEGKSLIIWTIHHALIDGRSMVTVLEDLFDLLAGRPTKSSQRSSAPFSAFCHAVIGRETALAERHFSAALAGFDEPNQFHDSTEDGIQLRKLQLEKRLDADLSDALRERSDAAGATLADLVHAAWGLVVARWTGRDEAVIGVTRSGRHVIENCARTVGCLINSLPLRMQLGPDKRADEQLAALRSATLALHPFEHAALTDVRRWAGLPATLPLFDSLVMFERASLNERMRSLGPEWQGRTVSLHEEGALPLSLAVYGDPKILLALEYDPGLVSPDQAQRMFTHLIEVLASFAKAGSATRLGTVTMLPRAEEASLLSLGRPAERLTPAMPCLATRLEKAASENADAPALAAIGTAQTLTHGALQQRANGLAAQLVQQGAGPGQIVAICLERSPEFIISILAVLKAGAAFLPVDPSYPAAVIAHMLNDCGAKLMIANPGTAHPDSMVLIPPMAAPQEHPLHRAAPDPDRLAYVIYTSGSTGVPKGVKVPMRAISAHASAIGAAFALQPSDRVLQFASLSFDVSIEEIVPTLLAGAQLVLRDVAMAGSVSDFLAAVNAHGITVLNLPTAFWHVLVDEMDRGEHALPASVRLVVVGGEQISPRALAKWQRMVPHVRWLNGYGPTETTITCTLHEPGPVTEGEEIPIGRPTAHACAYVLAADGSLAPSGAVGNLWIGGPAVSDGYIGRDEETRAVFQEDRFTGTGRIYNTGDRARWLPDGTLGFLGRQDRQVKLRGFRIDLRHVEKVLEKDETVGRALALVLNKGTPEARLAAWVTPATGHGLPDEAQLTQRVARLLPGHMLPAIVSVESLPRTAGGKIDTAALPMPTPRAAVTAPVDEADPTTQRLAELMAATLGLAQIGPDDSFHDFGGHSLLAVRLIGQIETEFNHRLGVGDLHAAPTPRKLAAKISAAQSGPRYIIPIQPKGSKPPIFGVHVLGRNEEYYRPLALELGPDQPILGLTVGLLTQDTPIGVEATAQVYFEEIQQHFPTGPIGLAAVSLGSYIAFELAQRLVGAGRDVRLLALFDAEGPGGRSRITGAARLLAHGRRLKDEGLGHVLRIVSNRLTDLRNRVERLRVRMASSKGEAAPLTIGTFVAANELAVQAYEAQPIDIPLTIFRAKENVFDSPESARDALGWAPVAAAGFRVTDIPGGHLTMLMPPNVAQIAGCIARAMESRD